MRFVSFLFLIGLDQYLYCCGCCYENDKGNNVANRNDNDDDGNIFMICYFALIIIVEIDITIMVIGYNY